MIILASQILRDYNSLVTGTEVLALMLREPSIVEAKMIEI